MQAEADTLGASVEMVKDLRDADLLVTTKSHYTRRPRSVRDAEENGMSVYVLRKGTAEQIRRFLKRFVSTLTPAASASNGGWSQSNGSGRNPKSERRGAAGRQRSAIREVEGGIRRVEAGDDEVALPPQNAFVRRLQHGVASRNNIGSASAGVEPHRYVILRRRSR
jgi:hypothetical protein